MSHILVSMLPLSAESSSGSGVAQTVLSVVGPAGLIAAVVALLKLKPDANSQAVTQAQGAAAEWEKLYQGAKVDIAYWRQRAELGEGLVEQLATTPEQYARLREIRNIDRGEIEKRVKAEEGKSS